MTREEQYKNEIMPKMKAAFGYKNDMEAPRLVKAVVNVGFGRHVKEKAYIESIVDGLTRVTGQKPVLTRAKKSISSFKIRQGMIIGACVTLRGRRMRDFTQKLINISFPRVRDFRGIEEKVVDRGGNLTVGFREHLAFPEIKADEVENVFGLEICLATTAKSREEGLELFRAMGFPFKKAKK